MKIQINSFDALQRLIGDDKEWIIEIKNSVFQKFSKTYLKGVVQEYIDMGVIRQLKEYVDNSLYLVKPAGWGKDRHGVLTNSAQDLIKSQAKIELQLGIRDVIQSLMPTDQNIEDMIRRQLNLVIAEKIGGITQEIIDDKVTQKIKSLISN